MASTGQRVPKQTTRQAMDVIQAKTINVNYNVSESLVTLDLSALADSDMGLEMVA